MVDKAPATDSTLPAWTRENDCTRLAGGYRRRHLVQNSTIYLGRERENADEGDASGGREEEKKEETSGPDAWRIRIFNYDEEKRVDSRLTGREGTNKFH